MNLNAMIGKTIESITNKNNDELIFIVSDDEQYIMYHDQDCCESVTIEDIIGDLDDLVGSPLVMAEEVVSDEYPDKVLVSEDDSDDERGYYPDSETWTFYKFATIKGYVTIRWYGTSNGYYSESVSFDKIGERWRDR